MRSALTVLMLVPLLLAACGDTGGEGEAPEKAVKAAAIADEIAKSPDDFEAILAKHDMTAEEFQELMFEIAEDDVLSAAYEAARKVSDPE